MMRIENQETRFGVCLFPAEKGTKMPIQKIDKKFRGKLGFRYAICIQPHHIALTGLKSVKLSVNLVGKSLCIEKKRFRIEMIGVILK